MKTNLFFAFLTLCLLSTLFLPDAFAQNYTQWHLPEGAKARLGKGVITDMALSPDGTRLAIASTIGVWLYDVSIGDEIALLIGHQRKVGEAMPRVAFSPDSRTLASSGYDETIRIWDGKTGEHLLTIDMPIGPARIFKFLTDGTWVTTVIPADEVESFEFLPDDKTQSIIIIPGGPLKSFKFLPDSKGFVIQNVSGTVWLWDLTTGKQVSTFSPKLPELRLDEYKTQLRIENVVDPTRWKLAADTFVDVTGGAIFAFAVGDKEGTISVQDSHTHRQVRTFRMQRTPTKDTDAGPSLPIQDSVPRPHKTGRILNKLPMTWIKWVTGLAFAPDGKTLVSRSEYRMLNRSNGGWSTSQGPTEIWDVFTGKQLAALPPFETSWSDVAVKFSADGKTLAITGSGGCSLWNVRTRTEIATFPGAVDVKFSADGKKFAMITDTSFTIWDIAKRLQIAECKTAPDRFALMPKRFAGRWEVPTLAAISSDGAILTAVDRQGRVHLWDTLTSTNLHPFTTGYTKTFTTLAFAHDGKTIASGDNAGNIQFWDINTGSVRKTLSSSVGKPIGGLAFATDGATLTSESAGNIERWNVSIGGRIDTYAIPDAARSGDIRRSIGFKSTFVEYRYGVAALTSSGGKLAVCHDLRYENKSQKITVWDISTGESLCTANALWGNIILAFTADGRTFATSGEKAVHLWDTYTGKQIITLNTSAYSGAFVHDGKTLAIGEKNNDNRISVWDLARQKRIITLKGHEYIICQLALSPDSTLLASGDSGGVIRLWELPSGRLLTQFKSPGEYVNKLVFAPDGKTLANTSGGKTFRNPVGTIFLWDVPSN